MSVQTNYPFQINGNSFYSSFSQVAQNQTDTLSKQQAPREQQLYAKTNGTNTFTFLTTSGSNGNGVFPNFLNNNANYGTDGESTLLGLASSVASGVSVSEASESTLNIAEKLTVHLNPNSPMSNPNTMAHLLMRFFPLFVLSVRGKTPQTSPSQPNGLFGGDNRYDDKYRSVTPPQGTTM